MKSTATKKVAAKKGVAKNNATRKTARNSREATLADAEETRKSARQGRRTTLRVPPRLEREISIMAGEHGISENEAMIRLAARGAQSAARERAARSLSEDRRAAIRGAAAGRERSFPSPDEAREAILVDRL
jgi:predicted HicB family RNase H-like nuclease